MAEPDDLAVAEYCLQRGVVTREGLRELVLQMADERRTNPASAPRPLGARLMERGALEESKLQKVLMRRARVSTDDTPKSSEAAFARLLIVGGAVTHERANRALKIQAEAKRAGRPPGRMGEIFVNLGFTTARRIARALAYQRTVVYFCGNCTKRYNIVGARSDGTYCCSKCGGEMSPVGGVSPGDTTMLRTLAPPAGPAAASIDRDLQIDHALAAHLLGKGLVEREAVRAALHLQTDLLRFGDYVALRELLERAGDLGSAAVKDLGNVDFDGVITSRDWSRQALPGHNVTGRIGCGEDADMLEATSRESGDPVVMKLMHVDRARDANGTARFRREAELLARLEHPRLVRVRESGALVTRMDSVEVPYWAADRLAGESLEQAMATRGPFAVAAAAQIALDVCEGLEFLRAHGDLRAEHILVEDDGHAKLADVGAGAGDDVPGLVVLLHAMTGSTVLEKPPATLADLMKELGRLA